MNKSENDEEGPEGAGGYDGAASEAGEKNEN